MPDPEPGDFTTPARAAKTCPFVSGEAYNPSCGSACGIWISHTEDPSMGFCAIMSIAISLAVLAAPKEKS